MSSSNPRWWLTPSAIFRYGVAVLSVTAALIIAWWMEFAWQSAAHVSLFLCAVMFSAWFGGIRPGLLAIALSVLAFDYYFLAMEIKQLPRLLIFALSAFFVALLIAAQRRAAESVRDARDDLHRTVQELKRINEALQAENSERKRAEDALRKSDSYLAEAQKLSQTGSWACTAERLETTYFSTEMFRILGLPPGENPPSTERIGKYFTSEAWARIMELFETARRKKVTCDGEFPMVLPDGSNRMIRIVGHPVLNAAGDIVEFVGTTIDITEQRQARAALEKALAEIKKSEDKLQIIIDTIPTLAWCTLPDGSAEFLNQRWLDYTGLSVEKARNWGWTVVLHIEDSTHLMDKWRASVATGEPFEAEARFRRADGTYRWCLARAVPLRDELGNIIRWYGTNTDIEDLKRAEEELHKARVELAHVTRVTTLGEMTASIAHEINQPLAAVVNNASACLRWLAGQAPNLEEARQSAAFVIADGHRAGEIISRIRALAKKSPPRKDWLDINETILEVIALARNEVEGNRVALKTQLSDELPLVLGDRIQLQQVILNLVMNGIEAMSAVADRSRDLHIRSRRHESDKVLVEVQDSGIGLEPESLDHLFTAFYTTKPKGMGMGLAISRSIIEAHAGRLWAAPNDGPGATFQFTLQTCSKGE
jgi:PAS domain S-box-containing protein